MKTSKDTAGRNMTPTTMTDQVGLVDVSGAGSRIESDADDTLIERNGRLVVPESGIPIDADDVRELRLAAQR